MCVEETGLVEDRAEAQRRGDGEKRFVVRFYDGRYLYACPSAGGGYTVVRVRMASIASRFPRGQAQAMAAAYWAVTGDGSVDIEEA